MSRGNVRVTASHAKDEHSIAWTSLRHLLEEGILANTTSQIQGRPQKIHYKTAATPTIFLALK